MSAGLSEDFTLLVPTYNRPRDLRRLLTYMKRSGSEFRVVVLDSSSRESALAENGILVQELGSPFERRTFEPSTTPFSKFYAGVAMVETPYCGMCADDDLIFTDSLPALIGALKENPAAVAAHGRCIGFSFAGKVVNSDIMVYSGASVTGPDGLGRIAKLFRRYEALTYAVHRTPVLRSAFAASSQMRSNLFAELAGSCTSLAFGDALRLQEITHARSFMPSHPYRNWHPTEYIYPDPSRMVSDYASFRSILLEVLEVLPSATDAVTLDLIMLRYCVPYLTPSVMRHFIRAALDEWPERIAIEGAWGALYNPSSLVEHKSGRLLHLIAMVLHPFDTLSRLLTRLKRSPWLRRVPPLRWAWRVTRPIRRELILLVHPERRGAAAAGGSQREPSPPQEHKDVKVALSDGWRVVFSRELVSINGLNQDNTARLAREFDAYFAANAGVIRIG